VITGQNDTVLLKVGQYDDAEVKDKVIYAFSCQSADLLGPDVIKHGARAFFGWTDDYIWMFDGGMFLVPWDDKYARSCMMPVVDGINALLDGKSCGEAKQVQLESYEKYILALDKSDEFAADLCRFNRDNFVMYGDAEARLNPRPALPFFFKIIPPPPLFTPISFSEQPLDNVTQTY
jgi:hypothetical protein